MAKRVIKKVTDYDEDKNLTRKQILFVEHYVENGFIAVKAYTQAFPEASIDTSRVNSYRLLSQPNIKKAVSERIQLVTGDKGQISNKLLKKLLEMALAEKDDPIWTPKEVLGAIGLLQKQLGLQTTNVNADVRAETVITINITEDEPADSNELQD